MAIKRAKPGLWRVDSEGVYLCPDCQEDDEIRTWPTVDPTDDYASGMVCEGCEAVVGEAPQWLLYQNLRAAAERMVAAAKHVEDALADFDRDED